MPLPIPREVLRKVTDMQFESKNVKLLRNLVGATGQQAEPW